MKLALSSLTRQNLFLIRQQRISSLCVRLGLVPLLWAWGTYKDSSEWPDLDLEVKTDL